MSFPPRYSSLLLVFILEFSEGWTAFHLNHHHYKQQNRNQNNHRRNRALSSRSDFRISNIEFSTLTSTLRLASISTSTSRAAISDENLSSSNTYNHNNNGNNNNRDRKNLDLFLFNSKSRSKERLTTVDPNKVSMYTCGPTVYDYAHVGNFRAFLTYDLIKRVLLYFGYDVTHVCNLTDVDDKIIDRANEEGLEEGRISELTQRYERYFFQDLEALNVVKADEYPRATEHIPEMMGMILELAKKNLAYETEDGSWYFATANQKKYGTQLVQLNVDEMKMKHENANANANANAEDANKFNNEGMKRNFQDFALWKAYKDGKDREDASWTEPSGKIQKGRPGWHIECSAMARKYLGDTIDLHGGGCDLQFPHHENEIAQSEGVTGKTFCNCWLHNGFVNINDEKMSKSLGNFLTLRKACPQSDDVRAFRFFVMSSQYQKQLSFTPQAMDAAKRALKRIDRVMQQIDLSVHADDDGNDDDDHYVDVNTDFERCTTVSSLEKDVSKAIRNFDAALSDDLSMPRASASLFALIKIAENEFKRAKKASGADGDGDLQKLDLIGLRSIRSAIRQMDSIFGIFYDVPEPESAEKEGRATIPASSSASNNSTGTTTSTDDDEILDKVKDLLSQRTDAKESKDWELADSLRARIVELGFAVKDVKGGDPIVSKIES